MLYLGTLDGLTQDIPTNWILICIWLMFSYLIEVCGFWLEEKHTHIQYMVKLVQFGCIVFEQKNYHMILAQFCPTNYSELQVFFDYYQVLVWLAKQTFTYKNGNPMVYNQSNDNLGFN